MKIRITTDSGTEIEVLADEDVGDLDSPRAREELMNAIRRATDEARDVESEPHGECGCDDCADDAAGHYGSAGEDS